MNEIKLPPLPDWADRTLQGEDRDSLFAWASAAIEADRQASGKSVAWLVTGPYEKTVFSDKTMAEKFCIGLNKGYGEVAYKVTPLYPTPQPQQQAKSESISSAFGPIKIGNLPTMNQDDYPDLGDWWVQLRIGPNNDEVLARVYGDTPQQAYERAVLLAKPQPPQIPEGYKLVPIEPTKEMLDARNALGVPERWNAREVYKAMLEAAQ